MCQLNNKKSTFWAFGDSYTVPTNLLGGLLNEYVEYKKYIPKNYVDIICEKLNFNQSNFAKGGVSNRTILSQFINVIDKIKENDIICFGWTNPGRFRYCSDDGEFYDILSSQKSHIPQNINISENTISELLINREHFLFLSEIVEYIKLIKKSFPKNKIINWTWAHYNEPSYPNEITYLQEYREYLVHQGTIEDIITETNGLVKDFHYSENGHKILADKIINYITL